MKPPILEICVDSRSGLEAAVAGGADRIELCAALDLGGLSPSPALLRAAQGCPLPVHVMIRPRPGDFMFARAEIADMCAEIAEVRAAGFAGVVLGAGSGDDLDMAALRELSKTAEGLGRTLHRVVDLLPDRRPALRQAIDLGFDRFLTSGGAPRAVDAMEDIATLVTAAQDRIAIMPGSGVTPENVAALMRRTGAREVHASARRSAPAHEPRLATLGFAAANHLTTSHQAVAALKAAIAACA